MCANWICWFANEGTRSNERCGLDSLSEELMHYGTPNHK